MNTNHLQKRNCIVMLKTLKVEFDKSLHKRAMIACQLILNSNNKELLNLGKGNPIDIRKDPYTMFLRFAYIYSMRKFLLPML